MARKSRLGSQAMQTFEESQPEAGTSAECTPWQWGQVVMLQWQVLWLRGLATVLEISRPS